MKQLLKAFVQMLCLAAGTALQAEPNYLHPSDNTLVCETENAAFVIAHMFKRRSNDLVKETVAWYANNRKLCNFSYRDYILQDQLDQFTFIWGGTKNTVRVYRACPDHSCLVNHFLITGETPN